MAVNEKNVLLTSIDAEGNVNLHYPVTKLECVDGADELMTLTGDIVTATGDGVNYTATMNGVAKLTKGLRITIIPDTTSTDTIPRLNVNGLGAKNIKQRLSVNTALTVGAANESWMVANKPVTLQFDGIAWVNITPRSSADDIYGIMSIENGGTGASTAEEARENLGAARKATVDGETLVL